MRSIRTLGTLGLSLVVTACVTINIYFPTSQAEDAAKEIVGDILGKPTKSEPAPGGDKSGALPQELNFGRVAQGVLDFFIPAAEAAQPDFNIETPTIRKLRASMKKRHTRLASFYDNGSIGFTQDAQVALRDKSLLSLRDQAVVKKLIAAENRDRNRLYQAIADANGHPEWQNKVRSVFAKTWIQEAKRGWWYQDRKGKWRRK